MNICIGMEVKQRGGGWIQPSGIGWPRVEIGIFQLKIKNGYLPLWDKHSRTGFFSRLSTPRTIRHMWSTSDATFPWFSKEDAMIILATIAMIPHTFTVIITARCRGWKTNNNKGPTKFNCASANTSTTTRTSSTWPTPKSDGITLCGASQNTVWAIDPGWYSPGITS